nr:MATE family efflux transporter [uncultured Clostridium sp.]
MKRLDSEFYKKLFALVVPIAFQNFMLAAVSTSDAIMLGLLNQDSLSAVSLAGQIQFVHSLFLSALVIGTTMLVAQYWGKENILAIEKIFANVIKISVIISMVFCFLAIAVPNVLMRIFTSDTGLIKMGAEYLKVVGISYLIIGISQIYLCMLKNSGQAFRSTLISSVAVLLNIALNAVFIFGLIGMPRLGITGAALATVIARVVELLWAIAALQKQKKIRFQWGYLMTPDYVLNKDYWKYTIPVLGNEIVWGGGFTMYSVIMGHLGSDAVAANSIANIVKNLIVCVSLGIGSGGGILVGNELGKGLSKKAKEYGDRLGKLSLICGILSGLLLLIISPAILKYSALSHEANEYLSVMLIICSCYLIGKSANSTLIGGIFCAGGDSRFGLICDAITMWILVIPFGTIAAFYIKAPVIVVYFILNLDEFIKLPAVYKHYKQYKWVKDITRDIEER